MAHNFLTLLRTLHPSYVDTLPIRDYVNINITLYALVVFLWMTLVLPLTRRSTLGDRAFPVAASRAWNSLPASVRDTQSLPAFRQKLKLTLFSDSFAR